ncbi:hypothetical protein PVAG01_08080 [Phlyctema vagabunda]|uniref:Uncharacterized protein n=1 Tax=Phlyctema vagabunda TaxID=108571 RepID=A0ABR4P8D9_9HELO
MPLEPPPSPTASLESIKLSPPRTSRVSVTSSPLAQHSPYSVDGDCNAGDMFGGATIVTDLDTGGYHNTQGLFIGAAPTKCHYTTLVHTCKHMTPQSYPRITHVPSCPGPGSVSPDNGSGDGNSDSKKKKKKKKKKRTTARQSRIMHGSRRLCDNLAQKPVLKQVETECGECHERSAIREREDARRREKKKRAREGGRGGDMDVDEDEDEDEERDRDWEVIEKKKVGRGLEPSFTARVRDMPVVRFFGNAWR